MALTLRSKSETSYQSSVTELIDKVASKKKLLIVVTLISFGLFMFFENVNVVRRKPLAGCSSLTDSLQDFDFVVKYDIQEATQERWLSHNCDLRPMLPTQFENREIGMQHCDCKRKIKVKLNDGREGPSLSDTTCSQDAYARGGGQKVIYGNK